MNLPATNRLEIRNTPQSPHLQDAPLSAITARDDKAMLLASFFRDFLHRPQE